MALAPKRQVGRLAYIFSSIIISRVLFIRIYHYVLDVVQRWFKENRIELATGWRRNDGGGAKTRGATGVAPRQGGATGGANLAYIYKLINQVILYIHNIITYCNRCGTKIGQGAPRALARCSRALLAYGH